MTEEEIDALKAKCTRFVRALEASPHDAAYWHTLSQDYVPEMRRQLAEHLPAWSARLDEVERRLSAKHDKMRLK
jgi:hypothetical protein